MKRKLVKLGPSTLVVSLPARWTKTYGLKAGDEIDVEERERTVTITTKKGFSLGKAEADLSGLDNLLKRIVAAKYVSGYDEIKVIFDDVEKARIVQKRARDLIGMDVVGQGENFVVLKEISKTTEDAFEPMLRRIFLLLLSIAEESEHAIARAETKLEHLSEMELSVNNFTDYCFRILNKKGHKKYRKTPSIYCVVDNLELLGDEYKKLLNFITANRIKLSQQQKKIYSDINGILRELYNLYYSYDDKKAVAMANKWDLVANTIKKNLKASKSAKEALLLKNIYIIAELIIRIHGHILVIES